MKGKNETLIQILKAAETCFSEKGFAGARMDEIAAAAGVNKATIYYNIGKKDALYTEVLKKMFDNALQEMETTLFLSLTPEEKLKAYIRSIAKTIDAHPNFPSIIMWEHASGGAHMPAEVVDIVVRSLTILDGLLKEGVDTGVFIKANTLTIQLMVMGTFMFYITSAPIRNRHHQFPTSLKETEPLLNKITADVEHYVLKAVKL